MLKSGLLWNVWTFRNREADVAQSFERSKFMTIAHSSAVIHIAATFFCRLDILLASQVLLTFLNWLCCIQFDQIGRFIGLWANF